jgi:hypothetical protein
MSPAEQHLRAARFHLRRAREQFKRAQFMVDTFGDLPVCVSTMRLAQATLRVRALRVELALRDVRVDRFDRLRRAQQSAAVDADLERRSRLSNVSILRLQAE